jgi:hypothetical protein
LIPALATAARLIPGPRTVDDAFITFRYARNLLAGNGLVYNPGEWVLGTTTPLYAFMLTVLGSIGGGVETSFPFIAFALNSIFDALTCYILIRIGESLVRPLAGISAALVWAIAPMSVTFSIGGMETSLLVLLMSTAFYFHVNHRSVLTALVGSLAVLTRPDALIFVSLLALERLLKLISSRDRRPSLAELLAFSIPIALWTSISLVAYGSPLPQSITAKTSAYLLPRDAGLIRLLQHYATPFFGHEAFGIWWIGLGLILFPALFIIGWRYGLKEHRHAWPLAIYPGFYFLVFAIANPLLFRWYLTPPLPMYFLGIFLGITHITTQAKRRWISLLFLASALALTLNAWTIIPEHGPRRPAPEMAYIKLEIFYRQAAESLESKLQTGDTLSAGDIGVLGYETNARIVDTVGLITPESSEYYPIPEEKYIINYAIPSDLILDAEPDYIVVLEVYIRETLLRDQRFGDQYRLFEKLDTDIYGSDGMLIFARK